MADLVERLASAGDRRHVGGWVQADEFKAVHAVLAAEYDAALEAEADRLSEIAEVFGLDAQDATVLWVAAAPDLDANVGLAYAALNGQAGLARATVGLALELAGVPTGSAAAFERLGPSSPLRRYRLVDVPGTDPWLGRAVRVPDSVTAALVGGAVEEPLTAGLLVSLVPLEVSGVAAACRAIENGVPLVWVRAAAGAAGTSLAAGALQRAGVRWLAVDVRRIAPKADLAEIMALCAREAGLHTRALVVTGGEVLADAADHSAIRVLAESAVPVIVVSRRAWNPGWMSHFPYVVDAEPLPAGSRAMLWQSYLAADIDDDDLKQTLLGLRLNPEDIAETGRYARLLATVQGRGVDAAVVRDAARRVGGTGGATADRVEVSPAAGGGPTFDDLILPGHVVESVRQLVSWGRHRNEVTAHGALRHRGRGIAALFAGSPGTGKTLAAHVVADELSVDLFQVELSSVVDKYIGETEKNLERVFQAAEALDVVLFFDEADALFGSRSEVRDARDRYANQEIAYLLQRMENFDGITILATNLRGNLDKAFSRRMSFIIHFPDPDPPIRRRIWEYHLAQLPELDRSDRIRVPFLAEAVEVTGGDIRNIVMAAAYEAVSRHEPVGMRHIVAATMREYHKLGKVIPDHGFVVSSPR